MLETCVLVGLDWVKPMMNFSLHVTYLCMVHTYIPFLSHFFGTLCWWCFFVWIPLSQIVCAWHPSVKLLRPRTLFVPGHLLLILIPFMSSSVMRSPIRTSQRTSPNVVFIQNATWFYQIFPILIYQLSFTSEDGNLYVRYPWVIPPWSYKSSTPICMVLIHLFLVYYFYMRYTYSSWFGAYLWYATCSEGIACYLGCPCLRTMSKDKLLSLFCETPSSRGDR